MTTTHGQDNRLRLSSILSTKGGGSFVNLAYGYDAASNVLPGNCDRRQMMHSTEGTTRKRLSCTHAFEIA
ncbi:MAG: hypothetical protein HY778_10690 [Betaproteobacteria bacterium]|nr:hypothetical protein [Betaproteobacteria bacterium]